MCVLNFFHIEFIPNITYIFTSIVLSSDIICLTNLKTQDKIMFEFFPVYRWRFLFLLEKQVNNRSITHRVLLPTGNIVYKHKNKHGI